MSCILFKIVCEANKQYTEYTFSKLILINIDVMICNLKYRSYLPFHIR